MAIKSVPSEMNIGITPSIDEIASNTVSLQELAHSIGPEGAIFSLLQLLKGKEQDISIVENTIVIKDLDDVKKFTFLIEYLCSISPTFIFNTAEQNYEYSFEHLTTEMELLNHIV